MDRSGSRSWFLAPALVLLIGQSGCWGPEAPLGVKAETDVNAHADAGAADSPGVELQSNDNPFDGGLAANGTNPLLGCRVTDEATDVREDDSNDTFSDTAGDTPAATDDAPGATPDAIAGETAAASSTTTGEPAETAAPPVETVRIHVDYYMQDCSLWEGQLFCHRVSDDGEHWDLDYYLFLDFFRWGYRYVLDGHYVQRVKNGALIDDFKVDQIVSEELVDPLSRFELHVNPTDNETGKLEHIALYSAGGSVVGGAITTRPFFNCYPEVCEALGVKMAGTQPFAVTFEYNGSMQLYAVEVDGEVVHGLPSEFVQDLRGAWEQGKPSSYVVRDCTEDAEPVCTLAAVDGGAVVALQTRTGDAEWTNLELAGDEFAPIDQQFEHLAQGTADSLIYGFRVDPDYQYVSRIDYGAQGTVRTHAITCFVADSVDPSVCEE